jgi:SAM-dependent methyltransferase
LAEEHSGIREDFPVARQLLAAAFPKGGMILDIGCASGFFLESLGANWERFGTEPFHLAAERARVHRGLTIHEYNLVAMGFPAQSFDVIEYLPNPMPIFQEARRILRPRGWLLLGTGDSGAFAARLAGSRWTYLCFPEHLSFLVPVLLRRGWLTRDSQALGFERIHHGEKVIPWQLGG